MDEFGFPCVLTAQQRKRLKIRNFTAENQWSCKYPSLASALAALQTDAMDELVVTHGMSPEYRCELWLECMKSARQLSTGGDAGAGASWPDYDTLVSQGAGLDPEVARQIELDLPRTFAEQRDFAAALAGKGAGFDGSRSSAAVNAAAASAACYYVPGGGDVHDALRRVLRTFAAQHPQLGYMQSMNFVAAWLLVVFGRAREADVYGCFETLVLHVLPGYYSAGMPSLQADTHIVTSLLPLRFPKLAAHLDKHQLMDMPALFLPRWFLCLFLNCFPADITVRTWDVLMLQAAASSGGGARTLCSVALAVLRICADDLLSARGFADAVEVLKGMGSRVLDAAELLQLSRHEECSMQGKSQAEWRELYAGPHAAEALRASACLGGTAAAPVQRFAATPGPLLPVARIPPAPAPVPVPVPAPTPTAAAAVTPAQSRLITAGGNGTPASAGRTPPVNIEASLDRVFQPLPPSPAHAAAALALKSPLRSPLRSPLYSPMRSPKLHFRSPMPVTTSLPGPALTPSDLRSPPRSAALTAPAAAAPAAPALAAADLMSPLSPSAALSPRDNLRRQAIKGAAKRRSLLMSPGAATGGAGAGAGFLQSPQASGLASPPLKASQLGTSAYQPKQQQQQQQYPALDSSAIAAALNSSTAAASARAKRRDEARATGTATGGAGTTFNGYASGTGAASSSASVSSMFSVPQAGSSGAAGTAAPAVQAAARLARSLMNLRTTAYPTAYADYEYDPAQDREMQALSIRTVSAASVAAMMPLIAPSPAARAASATASAATGPASVAAASTALTAVTAAATGSGSYTYDLLDSPDTRHRKRRQMLPAPADSSDDEDEDEATDRVTRHRRAAAAAVTAKANAENTVPGFTSPMAAGKGGKALFSPSNAAPGTGRKAGGGGGGAAAAPVQLMMLSPPRRVAAAGNSSNRL